MNDARVVALASHSNLFETEEIQMLIGTDKISNLIQRYENNVKSLEGAEDVSLSTARLIYSMVISDLNYMIDAEYEAMDKHLETVLFSQLDVN